MLLNCVALCGGRGSRGRNATCWALSQLSVTSPTSHKQIGPFWCWFPSGWFFVHSGTLWVSPTNSPVQPCSFSHCCNPHKFLPPQVLSLYFPALEPWLRGLSQSPLVPPGLYARKCGTSWPASLHLTHLVLQPSLATRPLQPSCTSLPLYQSGWMILL